MIRHVGDRYTDLVLIHVAKIGVLHYVISALISFPCETVRENFSLWPLLLVTLEGTGYALYRSQYLAPTES